MFFNLNNLSNLQILNSIINKNNFKMFLNYANKNNLKYLLKKGDQLLLIDKNGDFHISFDKFILNHKK